LFHLRNRRKTKTTNLRFPCGWECRTKFLWHGPWKSGELKIVWEVETGFMSGRLHKDPWGGTSWPGQPSIRDDRVYFPSADGNVYCLNRSDGSVIWKFKGRDSMKATPVIVGGQDSGQRTRSPSLLSQREGWIADLGS